GTLDKAAAAGVEYVIVPGWDLPSSEKAIELADKFEKVFAAVGYHPHDASKADDGALKKIAEMSSHEKVVAIGEIGLDYHYNLSPPEVQKKIFEAQIEIAKSVKLPVSIHNRESDFDLMEILERQVLGGWVLPRRFDYQVRLQPRGVLHSFNSTYEIARRAAALGFYLGISGMVTFGKDGKSELQKVVAVIEPEHFLAETDAPYLAPVPHRGKDNEPAFVPYIVEKIAQLQELTVEDIRRITSYNAYKLFGVGEKPQPKIAYQIRNSLYLNLTLRCDADCIFCDRKGEAMVKGHNLHIEKEPTPEELIREIGDPKKFKEIVFCGYGEPTIRLDVVKDVARYVKEKGGMTRLDTDGHGNIINHRDILPEIKGLIDSVSISLNSTDPDEYRKLMGTPNGKQWDSMLEFAKRAKEYVPKVYMSIVGVDGLDVESAKEFVEKKMGAEFRFRPLF
ncbi:MAG TPA: YchF/TatD family DNA exonuclease, partial [Candidatus Kryptobacter bacterium]|nr:YchF/TatD family DNA exonuclease [Candidatus Kryptobacter bacterium]